MLAVPELAIRMVSAAIGISKISVFTDNRITGTQTDLLYQDLKPEASVVHLHSM